MAVVEKIRNKIIMWNFTSEYRPQKKVWTQAHIYLYVHSHTIITNKSQKVGATQVSTDREMEKQNVAYT